MKTPCWTCTWFKRIFCIIGCAEYDTFQEKNETLRRYHKSPTPEGYAIILRDRVTVLEEDLQILRSERKASLERFDRLALSHRTNVRALEAAWLRNQELLAKLDNLNTGTLEKVLPGTSDPRD